jgi:Skp family chaperone for outer membrane proteins
MFFNKKLLMTTVCALTLSSVSLIAKVPANAARVTDFRRCFMESELGKQEQESFKAMQEQMEKSVKEVTDQLTDIGAKLADEDILDSLSKEAEDELKAKQATLAGELQRYQMQFPQILQQAQNQSFYNFREKVKVAAAELASEKKYGCILNEEQAFFYKAELDVTDAVIAKLDKMNEEEAKKAEKAKADAAKVNAEAAKAEKENKKAE